MDERATRLNERTRLLQMEQEEEEKDEFWREERTKDYALLVFILLAAFNNSNFRAVDAC